MQQAAENSTTQNPIQLPEFGTFMLEQGGHFIDVIRVGNHRYGFVAAPKLVGEHEGTWGEPGVLIEGASHFSDGVANTEAMAAAGSEIALWARGLDINGKKDWHIPSRDEKERMYRRGKPGTDENGCWYRDGENPNSIPMGLLYTESDPPQTPVEAFQTGGPEAMEEVPYWTSTQYSANAAFSQYFGDGHQSGVGKDDTLRVRAVRRFLID